MMGFLSKTIQLLTGNSSQSLFKPGTTERELIQRESEIGAQLFGPVPEGHHRKFFNLDRTTWIWYEEWHDSEGKLHSTTTRYEVHPNGILKVQEGAPYYYIEGQELNNLLVASRMYFERVAREVYQYDPTGGKPLAVS